MYSTIVGSEGRRPRNREAEAEGGLNSYPTRPTRAPAGKGQNLLSDR